MNEYGNHDGFFTDAQSASMKENLAQGLNVGMKVAGIVGPTLILVALLNAIVRFFGNK